MCHGVGHSVQTGVVSGDVATPSEKEPRLDQEAHVRMHVYHRRRPGVGHLALMVVNRMVVFEDSEA